MNSIFAIAMIEEMEFWLHILTTSLQFANWVNNVNTNFMYYYKKIFSVTHVLFLLYINQLFYIRGWFVHFEKFIRGDLSTLWNSCGVLCPPCKIHERCLVHLYKNRYGVFRPGCVLSASHPEQLLSAVIGCRELSFREGNNGDFAREEFIMSLLGGNSCGEVPVREEYY